MEKAKLMSSFIKKALLYANGMDHGSSTQQENRCRREEETPEM
jgi:hypothetical protein